MQFPFVFSVFRAFVISLCLLDFVGLVNSIIDETSLKVFAMSRCLGFLLVSLAVVFAAAPSARAADNTQSWIFRPSYYSHDPVMQVQIGPRFDGGPYFAHPQGSYIRSGYNQTQSWTPNGGWNNQNYNAWESWFQVGAQY